MENVRVLIVDDSVVSYAMIEGLIEKAEFKVCGYAKNAAEAVEKYQSLMPDIVTMDMNLPDADGMECSRRILLANPKAKIVMISAMRDARLISQGRAVGIKSFLQKPIEADELIETLRMVCDFGEDAVKALQVSYVTPFMQSLRQNLFSLAGLHSEVEVERDLSSFIEVNGIAVILGLTGSPMGRVVFYTDEKTMLDFSRIVFGAQDKGKITDEQAIDGIEESANIIAGRSVSVINDIYRNKELRVTPPGTLFGKRIHISNQNLTSFMIKANTRLGVFHMSVGFAGGE